MPQPGIGTPELAPSSADNCVIWCVPSLPWGSVSSALSQEQGQVAAQAPCKHGVLELWPLGEAGFRTGARNCKGIPCASRASQSRADACLPPGPHGPRRGVWNQAE